MKDKKQEALELSNEILRNFELSEIPLQNIVLKCLRLARLLNDLDAENWLKYEANGFDTNSKGFLTSDAWAATEKSGRRFFIKDDEGNLTEKAFTETIAVMESAILVNQKRMEFTVDRDISISSNSNLNPVLPLGNVKERGLISKSILKNTERIQNVKSRIYEYVLSANYELRFGEITGDIFLRKRNRVDTTLKESCPVAIKKFISVYENLNSENDEDWANAVHSCRRILKELADQLYPPSEENFVNKNGKEIKIGNDQYINRLMLYIESKANSNTFKTIVGSHINYIGERIDSIADASNKGSHHEVSKSEAETYIIYTYLIIGDILEL
jgi:hypothetical protein